MCNLCICNKNMPKKQKPKMTLEQERVYLLKSELNYFKGLSILLTVMIVCVFFAFGSLFSAMYLEVKIFRQTMEDYMIKKSIVEWEGETLAPNDCDYDKGDKMGEESEIDDQKK